MGIVNAYIMVELLWSQPHLIVTQGLVYWGWLNSNEYRYYIKTQVAYIFRFLLPFQSQFLNITGASPARSLAQVLLLLPAQRTNHSS